MGLDCRLCMENKEETVEIFLNETESVKLPSHITLCTSVQIIKGDGFPQQICCQCHHFIQDWVAFRTKCQEVNNRLMSSKMSLLDEKTAKEDTSYFLSSKEISKNKAKRVKTKLDVVNVPGKTRCLRSLTKSKISNKPKTPPKLKPKPPKNYPQCCGQTFITNISYRIHVSKNHPTEKKLYFCEECGKKGFSSETTLRRHKSLHAKRHWCEICEKSFTCHAILRIHERDKHEHDRPFVCDVCGKAFVTSLLLSYHQRFHTGEKKYICEVCGSGFVTSSGLCKHKRIHNNVKPHVCEICAKGFTVRSRLTEHIRVHTGERPYGCDVCEKTFTMHDKLKRHMKTHNISAVGP